MTPFIKFTEFKHYNYGGKANNLAILSQNKFNVPQGFVISSEDIEQILQRILPNKEISLAKKRNTIQRNQSEFEPLINKSWAFCQDMFCANFTIAVRSSANLEDGIEYSFAGQFTSVLEINSFIDYQKAFMSCLLSKYNPEPQTYCDSNQIDSNKLQLNIIVQQMVDADFSGVCFSVNPLTGNEKEMIIESISGLGEKLVQGQENPHSYLINWYDEIITNQHKNNSVGLSKTILDKIVSESLKIQQYFGVAQDIEWAVKDNVLHILQARPLTAIHFKTNYNWTNADLKDGGVSSEIATPFMYKLYETAFSTTISPYLKSIKIHPPYQPEKWFTQFMLFSYWNLSAVKDGTKRIPGFVEKEFDEDLGVKPTYKGKGEVTKISAKSLFNGLQILLAINKSAKNTINKSAAELEKIDSIISKYKHLNWNELSDTNFIAMATNLISKDYLFVEGSYFKVIYDNSNVTTLFKDLLAKKNKKNSIHYLKLITGLQNLSHLQPSFYLWKFSREILNDIDAKLYYLNITSKELGKRYHKGEEFPLRNKITLFLNKFGFHSEKELNILTPNWHENPQQALQTLFNFIHRPDNDNIIIKNEKQKYIFEEEFSKITSTKLKKEIKKHRYFLWLREEYRDRSTQMYDVIRQVFLHAGERLVKKGIVAKKEFVFFIAPDNIGELFKANSLILKKLHKNQIIHKSFRNFKPPNEIWRQSIADLIVNSTEDSLKGIACSFGIVEGEIFLAKTVKDADNMPNDMIMLTQFTDPAWTVYFSKIKGLITETGGLLSHGAIISREYGIPSVLGVTNATTLLKTGDKVRLDGTSGFIEIIS